MALAKDKYKEAIVYLCEQSGGEIRGKKKLAKLLYFLDFDNYEKNHKSITGDTYKKLPMGPFPCAMTAIVSELTKNKRIEMVCEQEKESYNPTEIYRCNGKADTSVFDPEELLILQRVVRNYGHLNGKQLEDLSHAEAPYLATEPKDEIAYELAYYRGTDFDHA